MTSANHYLETQAIVLRSFPFQEKDLLLTLFSKEQGIVKLIIKGGQARLRQLQGLCSPLCLGEFLYLPSKGEFGRFRDAKLLHDFPHLRQDYDHLESAGRLLRHILHTQLPGKPAPLLYTLLERYLQHLPSAKDLPTLELSFYMKLLLFEGTFYLHPLCQTCQNAPNPYFLDRGQTFCEHHAPTNYLKLERGEYALVHLLAHSRSIQEITQQVAVQALIKKVFRYLEELRRI